MTQNCLIINKNVKFVIYNNFIKIIFHIEDIVRGFVTQLQLLIDKKINTRTYKPVKEHIQTHQLRIIFYVLRVATDDNFTDLIRWCIIVRAFKKCM